MGSFQVPAATKEEMQTSHPSPQNQDNTWHTFPNSELIPNWDPDPGNVSDWESQRPDSWLGPKSKWVASESATAANILMLNAGLLSLISSNLGFLHVLSCCTVSVCSVYACVYIFSAALYAHDYLHCVFSHVCVCHVHLSASHFVYWLCLLVFVLIPTGISWKASSLLSVLILIANAVSVLVIKWKIAH